MVDNEDPGGEVAPHSTETNSNGRMVFCRDPHQTVGSHDSGAEINCVSEDDHNFDLDNAVHESEIRAEVDPTFASFHLSANMILSDSVRQALLESPNAVSRIRYV